MKTKTFRYVLMIILISGACQKLASQSLSYGKYKAGFKLLSLRYNDTTRLDVSLYYPTQSNAGKRISLLEFTHNNTKNGLDDDAAAEEHITALKNFIEKNFGAAEENKWTWLNQQPSNSYRDAPHPNETYPLIIGRLRLFSTHLTCEYLATHGFIVAMLEGVEDYPPSDREKYYLQINREMDYYRFVGKYLRSTLKVANKETGLLGFSGGGFSQFFAAMHNAHYKALALIESGIFLDGDLFDIVSGHPYYNPPEFSTPLLFLYNKQRFDVNKSSENFWKLKTRDKFLVLFDDPTQHHWDFATEGFVASSILRNRASEINDKQMKSFVAMNELILQFFDIYLKKKPSNFRAIRKEGIIIK